VKVVVKKKRINLPELSLEQLVEENRGYIEYLKREGGEEAVRKYLDELRKEYEKAKKQKSQEIDIIVLQND